MAFILGPTFAVIIGLSLNYNGWDSNVCWAGAIATLCAIWWIFEPLPTIATSLIPLAIFPTLNIMSHQEVAAAYGHKLILLLLEVLYFQSLWKSQALIRKLPTASSKQLELNQRKKLSFHSCLLPHYRVCGFPTPLQLSCFYQSSSHS